MLTSAATLAVFAPSPLVTVTVEKGDPDPEIHFHAGGQGVWVARLAGALGARVMLATTLGGESGRVLSAVLEAPGVEVHAVPIAAANGAYIHDRRSGRRQAVIEVPAPRLQRHEVDDLYGIALADALAAGVSCLTGPSTPASSTPMSTTGWRATCGATASPSSPTSPGRRSTPPCGAASTCSS